MITNTKEYKCVDCNFSSKLKRNLLIHCAGKKHVNLMSCKYCKMLLNSINEKNIHEDSCPNNKKIEDIDFNDIINENQLLKEKNELLQNEMNKLILKHSFESKKLQNEKSKITEEFTNFVKDYAIKNINNNNNCVVISNTINIMSNSDGLININFPNASELQNIKNYIKTIDKKTTKKEFNDFENNNIEGTPLKTIVSRCAKEKCI